jgi:hypothetical protein
MSDAKPRTSLRSYWHTLLKKKEQTPLKTRVRYNKAISVHLLTEPYVDVTAHTAPSQQAVSFPLEVMEVWINRRKVFIPYKPALTVLNMDGERSSFFRGAPDHI